MPGKRRRHARSSRLRRRWTRSWAVRSPHAKRPGAAASPSFLAWYLGNRCGERPAAGSLVSWAASWRPLAWQTDTAAQRCVGRS